MVAQRGEGDENHPVREIFAHRVRDSDGKAGLADAAGAGEGEDAHLRPQQHPGHGLQVALAPDQGRGQRRRPIQDRPITDRRARGCRACGKLGTLVQAQAERIGEQADREGPRLPAAARLQGGHGVCAQASALGERLLGQTCPDPQAPQQRTKRGLFSRGHMAFLPPNAGLCQGGVSGRPEAPD